MEKDIGVLADAIYTAGVHDLERMTTSRSRAAVAAQTVAGIVVHALANDPDAVAALKRLITAQRSAGGTVA